MIDPIAHPDLADVAVDRLQAMADAGRRVQECQRVLEKSKTNLVGEILRGQGEFFEWDHYPKGDVYDHETHAQYYYHAHPPETRIDAYGQEHGHFHTFLRPKGMPPGVEPAAVADYEKPAGDNDALSHLVAISMDRRGLPTRLFTTNRWVTGEIWYDAAAVSRMLGAFKIDLSYPSWPVNIWISAMMVLFRPTIDALLHARDASIAAGIEKDPDANVYEDRDLEVTSLAEISVDEQLAAVDRALQAATS
jgi:hypothetical protein